MLAALLFFTASILRGGDAVLTGGGLKEKLASQRVGASSAEGLQPAVIATEYIEKGDIAGGQNATQVVLPGWTGPTQHSGFFRFNGQFRPDGAAPVINSFFWFLPSLDNNPDAPVLLWLQGGPGASSLYGMFTEIGPFTIDANGEVVERSAAASSWNQHYSLLFIDNPVGVGWSWSDDVAAFVTDEKQVGSDVADALGQFFQLFPEQATSDFFVTGESYAGKYVPATAYTVMVRNEDAVRRRDLAATKGAAGSLADYGFINLKGLSVGDGAMDPPSQFSRGFGDLLWYTGMVDEKERKQFHTYESRIQASLAADDADSAFAYFDEMLNGDFQTYPTLYNNATGMYNYFNFEQGECGACNDEGSYFGGWMSETAQRNLLHVGGLSYDAFNDTVEVYLKHDWMVGVAEDMLVPLLVNTVGIRTLVYSGQNDIILGPPLTEQFLYRSRALAGWEPSGGRGAFEDAAKVAWTVDTDATANDPLAGYVKHLPAGVSEKGTFAQFTYAVVRGAGHMVPTDQPQRAFDLITKFVSDSFGGSSKQ